MPNSSLFRRDKFDIIRAARGQKASFCRKLRGVKAKKSNLYPTIQKSNPTKNHATADTTNS